MWFLSAIADKVEEWQYRIEERVDSFIVGGKARFDVHIFPRGTKSSDHLLIEVRDNEAESKRKHGTALMLLLSELVDLKELRTAILWFIVGPEQEQLIERIDTNLANLDCMELSGPSLSLWNSYTGYMRSVVIFPSERHKPPTGSDEDNDKSVALSRATLLVAPILLSLHSVDVKLFYDTYMGACHTIVDNSINILTEGAPVVREKNIDALELSNNNRVLFLYYDTYKESVMSLLQ